MRENNLFYRQARNTFYDLQSLYVKTRPDSKIIKERFLSTGQEAVRMGIALWFFYNRELFTKDQYHTFESYLRAHIRLALEFFIEEDNTQGLKKLETQGWVSEIMLDECLKKAVARRKTQALIFLLEIKNQKFGFKDCLHEL